MHGSGRGMKIINAQIFIIFTLLDCFKSFSKSTLTNYLGSQFSI
jgi:hypothetical protein